MDRGTSQGSLPPPPLPVPLPVNPTSRAGDPQPPATSGTPPREAVTAGVAEPRPPERVSIVRTVDRPKSGGEESDKNPFDSIEGHSVAHTAPFESVGDAPTAVPRAPRSREALSRVSRRGTIPMHGANTSEIDWIVPLNEKSHRKTCAERLKPTMDAAQEERDKYKQKALVMGYSVNTAMGLQVLLGALTTGVAAAVQNARQAQVSTAILGGLSTLVASYLARTRGSGEPELSITRVKDLDHFLRDCNIFQMDHGHEYGTNENGLNQRLESFRRSFEELLGNASGERKLSPPV